MRNLRCCIIDDEPLAQELIKSYVAQTPFLELVDTFPSASMAVKTIIEDKIDLVFLDIQMSELNGIEFAKVIPPISLAKSDAGIIDGSILKAL